MGDSIIVEGALFSFLASSAGMWLPRGICVVSINIAMTCGRLQGVGWEQRSHYISAKNFKLAECKRELSHAMGICHLSNWFTTCWLAFVHARFKVFTFERRHIIVFRVPLYLLMLGSGSHIDLDQLENELLSTLVAPLKSFFYLILGFASMASNQCNGIHLEWV